MCPCYMPRNKIWNFKSSTFFYSRQHAEGFAPKRTELKTDTTANFFRFQMCARSFQPIFFYRAGAVKRYTKCLYYRITVAHRFYHFLFLFYLFISVRCASNRPIQLQFTCFKSWLELHKTWSVVLVVEVLV